MFALAGAFAALGSALGGAQAAVPAGTYQTWRSEAAQTLRDRIQTAADARKLGVKILFVGLQDIHPPVKVASDYEKVVGAQQQMIAIKNNAVAEAIRTNALAGALAFTTTNIAAATRQRL